MNLLNVSQPPAAQSTRHSRRLTVNASIREPLLSIRLPSTCLLRLLALWEARKVCRGAAHDCTTLALLLRLPRREQLCRTDKRKKFLLLRHSLIEENTVPLVRTPTPDHAKFFPAIKNFFAELRIFPCQVACFSIVCLCSLLVRSVAYLQICLRRERNGKLDDGPLPRLQPATFS